MNRLIMTMIVIVVTVCGCGQPGPDVPQQYDFDNASYSGQTFRHVLIADTKARIASLTAVIDDGTLDPVANPGAVTAELLSLFDFDDANAADTHSVVTDPPALQTTYGEISSGKDLRTKVAGNDEDGQHKNWNTEFSGWSGATSPQDLLLVWFNELDLLGAARVNGTQGVDPDGAALVEAFVNGDGLDYQQLIQKFLDAAIAYSQGTDDYLDDDFPGKGLLSDNTTLLEGQTYTALEHAWDEGFGYWGGRRDYGDFTDDENASPGHADTDQDGFIDLLSEKNLGHSINAAKRSRDSVAGENLTGEAFHAFKAGRQIISQAQGRALDGDEMVALLSHRDAAVLAWEKAIGATMVHYINDVIKDMDAIAGPDAYNFYEHAKHWSELKGFALALQFNPHSPISDADEVVINDLIGQAPVLPGGDTSSYESDLLSARNILQSAYQFDPADAVGW